MIIDTEKWKQNLSKWNSTMYKNYDQLEFMPGLVQGQGIPSTLFCSVVSVQLFFDSVDCTLPGSSVHGILQARILKWVAIPFSRRSSWSKDWTQVSWIAVWFFIVWTTREIHIISADKRKKKMCVIRSSDAD